MKKGLCDREDKSKRKLEIRRLSSLVLAGQ